MSDDKVFVEGMFAKPGPDSEDLKWIKAKLSIKLDDFGSWIAAQKKADPDVEWLNIDIKEGRSGKWYLERDMWKPKPQQEALKPDANFKSDDIPW